MTYRLISPPSRAPKSDVVKPETIVVCESDGIRERLMAEPIHYRGDATFHRCAACGGYAGVWLATVEGWENHPNRCR